MGSQVYTLCLLGVGLISLVQGASKQARCSDRPQLTPGTPPAGGHRPNIIYFMIDDLGYNDVGYHDCNVKTPTIDKLGKEGLILENNYMAPACSPSRAAMLTGRYSFVIGEQHGVLQTDTPACLVKDHPLLPQALQKLDYKTYMVGKWHEGYCNETCLPTRRGFDEFYGFYNGLASHFSHLVDGFYDWRDHEKVDWDAMGHYDAELLAARAVKNIRDHAADPSGKPMYMYFAFPTVHSPLEAPGKYVEMYMDEPNVRRRMIKAMVTATDAAIDTVLLALKQYGLYNNSVIVVSSDNGGEAGFSSNHPLRGAKGSSWEGGVRVPGLFHSPLMAESAKGKVTKGLFHGTDWYATFVSMAGGTPAHYLSGYDQSLFLLNGANSSRTIVPIHWDQNPGPLFGRGAVRSGRWKLMKGFPGLYNGYDGRDSDPLTIFFTHLSPDIMTNQDPAALAADVKDRAGDGGLDVPHGYAFDWAEIGRYTAVHDDDIHLFDLEVDPAETNNLAASNPALVKQLLDTLKTFADMAVPITPESTARVPKVADPRLFGGAWSTGWC